MRQWADDISVTDDDIEYLTGLLLERETPLSIDELAHALVAYRLEQEAAAQRERFKDSRVYNPAQSYEVGQKVYFPALEYRVGTVKAVRAGDNAEYGDFSVIAVEFADTANSAQEFAAALTAYHRLSDMLDVDAAPMLDGSADELFAQNRHIIVPKLEERLHSDEDLVSMAGKWFSRGLMLDVNEGHLNLAEAVLYTIEGGPMSTEQIVAEIGGVSDTASLDLQMFCVNSALNEDKRFDEVGPLNSVMWYLRSFEPAGVLTPPTILKYNEIDYDPSLLTAEQIALEAEIDDEWSPERDSTILDEEVTLTLNFPHWRAGTLPLNTKMRHIFPTARRTQRIAVTVIDGQDGELYSGWVVRPERFVYGLETFYRKHKLPIGAFITVRRTDDKIVVDYRAHRPHTEWVRVIETKNNQATFDEQRRAVGAEYDDLMILWADDPTSTDAVYNGKRPLTQALRAVAADLTRVSPQGTVHAKTLYSATNVLRRSSPGAVFATLNGDPEFQYVGNHYWRFGA